ncbi:MAG: cob(I)yrinic acid a,c-diamide adenosyltransferase [Caldiserica bacterium]|jgi:cob(I)alamin adenosyltransferase|nr:cob(I)yrinic acid a,c-diamide adenosyltransferase [Caldisericota bacterium]MDH7563079.1 cob(I)yrinic acid a,c-diamide adenosyltransferase [Caldisericota bacterium]
MQKEFSRNKPETGKGLTIVITGDGKGKTTAALGMALRSAGHGMKSLMIQFIKDQEAGEHLAIKFLSPYLEIIRCGRGFVRKEKGDLKIHKEAAVRGLNLAQEKMESGNYDLIILDEIFPALTLGLISLEEILSLIARKPERTHLILTGRGAPKEVIDLADTVSEIREIKHAFRKGIPAKKGIEF